MNNFSELIKKVSEDSRLKPDLLKAPKGNNFRAVSESAILEVINPVLNEAGIFYSVEIKEQHLEIVEAFSKGGKKLQFIATICLTLRFWQSDSDPFRDMVCLFSTDSVGMGIDDNDKAMGKAYTYALKYALLKLFRLRYSDDPDFESSEPLMTEASRKEPEKEQKPKTVQKSNSEIAMTEAQRDYIIGMAKKKGVEAATIISKFDYDPFFDEYIPMKVARAMIKFLEEKDDLPF